MLCRDIVRHVLPKPLQDEIRETIGRASVLLADGKQCPSELDSFAQPLGKGTIDYTPFQQHIESIQTAMHGKRLCDVLYCPRYGEQATSYTVAPLGILAFHEALYLRCVVCDYSGTPAEATSRTFAVQRIRRFEVLKRHFADIAAPVDDGTFGFPFHEPIRVRVAFSKSVATYVSERVWSKDQWIRKRKGGGITLTFTSTSRQEVVSWVLGFAAEAELLEPNEWRKEIKGMLKDMGRRYE
jgi:predicted DNA-binding transcriptional regulator YafY